MLWVRVKGVCSEGEVSVDVELVGASVEVGEEGSPGGVEEGAK